MYSTIIAHKETITMVIFPNNLIRNGVAAPKRYAGKVTASFVLNPIQENISYKATQVINANAAGKIYVLENHKIGKSIIMATTEVIVRFNI